MPIRSLVEKSRNSLFPNLEEARLPLLPRLGDVGSGANQPHMLTDRALNPPTHPYQRRRDSAANPRGPPAETGPETDLWWRSI